MARGIQDLPDELLLMIFSHLSFYDIMAHIQRVCVRWMVVSSEECLWKTSGVLNWMEDAENLETFLEQFGMISKYMKTLCIKNINGKHNGDGLGTGLERLYRRKFAVTNSLLFLRDDINCPRLERIQVMHSDLILEEFSNLLVKYPHITEVSFGHNNQIRYDTVVPAIKNLLTLTKLQIDEEHFYSDMYDDMDKMLFDDTWNRELRSLASAHPELTSLDINSTGLRSQTIEEFIQKCPKLKCLRISQEQELNSLRDNKAAAGLEEIVFEDCSIDTDGIRNLTAATKWKLKKLSLLNCLDLDEHACQYIGQQSPLLENFIAAKPITLSDRETGFGFLTRGTLINNKGLMYLSSCKNLQVLKLSYSAASNVSDEGILAIAQGCPELKTIDLEGCFGVTDFGVLELSRHCPKLNHVNLTFCLHVTGFGISCLMMNCLWLQRLQVHSCFFISNVKLHDHVNFPGLPVCAITPLTELENTQNENEEEVSCTCYRLLQHGPSIEEGQRYCVKVYQAYDKIKQMLRNDDQSHEEDSGEGTGLFHSNAQAKGFCEEGVERTGVCVSKTHETEDCGSRARSIEDCGQSRATGASGSKALATDTCGAIFQGPRIPPYKFSSEHSWLRNLDLSCCHRITDADITEISRCCPDIQILDLSFCPQLTDEGVEAVAHHLKILFELALEGIRHLTDRSLIALTERNLGTLTLNTSSNMSIQELQELVHSNSRLRKLTIFNDETTSAVFNKDVIDEIVSQAENCFVVKDFGLAIVIKSSS
ncbi:uncharacterized protein LOC134282951 [Saccostrea cucullata]|uniref:uncharacterized protein LOC134282951 n=1 Tax=Saccostrea cuccullata TaxID=36930 RepID=UPI002ED03739